MLSDDSSPPVKVARKELSSVCDRNSKEWTDMSWAAATQHENQEVDVGKINEEMMLRNLQSVC